MTNPSFDDVPADAKRKIASLLPVNDVLSLSRASKKQKSDIGFSVIGSGLPLLGRNNKSWHGEYALGDIPRRGPEIPNLFGAQAHTICLQCDFVDQGWGNQKGQIFIVADDKNEGEPYDPNQGIQSRRVLAASPVAQHHSTSVKLSFQPSSSRSDEKYHLWYKVGGGGGHSLHVSNAKVFYAILGEQHDQQFERAASFLDSAGLWAPPPQQHASHLFCRTMAVAVVESLDNAVSNGCEPDPILAAFFQSNGYGVDSVRNKESLGVLRRLLGKVIEYHEATEQYYRLELASDENAQQLGGLSEFARMVRPH